MRLAFFFEMFEIKCAFRNAVTNWEKIFSFLYNSISIHCSKFSLLQRKSFSWGVNVLKNGFKISDIIKKHFFQLKISQSNEQSS